MSLICPLRLAQKERGFRKKTMPILKDNFSGISKRPPLFNPSSVPARAAELGLIGRMRDLRRNVRGLGGS